MSWEDVRARLRPRYGREREEIGEATGPREATGSLLIGAIRRSGEVKELAESP